jgi:O-antigen/teichoic acid export membrane protein
MKPVVDDATPYTTPTHSPLRRIAGNMGHLLSGKAVAGVTSLIYLALAARILGVRDYGTLNLVHAYATFFGTVLALSGFHGIVRFGAQSLQSGNREDFWGLVRFLTLIEVGMALCAMLCAALLAPWATRLLQLDSVAAQFVPFYVIAIFATVRTTPQGLLQLANRFDLIGIQQAVMPVARLIGVAGLWWVGAGLTGFIWVWGVAAVLEGLSMWIMAYYVAKHKGWISGHPDSVRAIAKNHPSLLNFVGITNIDLTLRDLAPRATPLIIGWILGPAATGLYVLAQRASAVLIQPAQLLSQAGYSVITTLVVEGQFAKAHAAVWKSILIAAISGGLVAILFMLFSEQILQILGGKEFTASSDLLVMIGIAAAILSVAPILSAAIVALGYPGRSTSINLFCNLGGIPVLIFALWEFGLEGAGVHALVQSSVFALLLGFSYHRIQAQVSSHAA